VTNSSSGHLQCQLIMPTCACIKGAVVWYRG